MSNKFITAAQAAELITDGSTVVCAGFAGNVIPEEVYQSVEKRFLETGSPNGIKMIFCACPGNFKEKGINHLGHEGLLDTAIGGHWSLAPKVGNLAVSGKIKAYNFPQGVLSQMMRETAAKKPFILSRIGLETFVDPRLEGGKLNRQSTEDLVELTNIDGYELLKYKTHPIDFAILRGTTADEKGNISMEHETLSLEMLSMAMACRNCGGKVIVQVKRKAIAGTLNPYMIKIPYSLVDYVVVASEPELHPQTFDLMFEPSLSGEIKSPLSERKPMSLNERKVVARRAFFELKDGSNINLGIGMPDGVSSVATEEGTISHYNFSIESGTFGGFPMPGLSFGSTFNPDCIVDQTYMFDFYQGGGLNQTFLGLAQADRFGNINVSKFGSRVSGCGGFVDITQSTKFICFLGTMTADGLEIEIHDGKVRIVKEGKQKKFVKDVEQVTFSAHYAKRAGQTVKYITERCVFELAENGLLLTEIAPGIDLNRDILDQMEFVPEISSALKQMDSRIFREHPMTK